MLDYKIKENKTVKYSYNYIIPGIIIILILFVLSQYTTLYDLEKDMQHEKILKQVRICGRDIEAFLYDFEEQAGFLVTSFDGDNLFTEKLDTRFIIDYFNRFSSQYQDILTSIRISNNETGVLFKKSPLNYFTVIKNDSLAANVNNTHSGELNKSGNYIYYNLPYLDKNGNHIYDITFKVSLTGLVKSGFTRYYIERNSYYYLISSKGEIPYLFYTEGELDQNNISFSDLNTITEKISDGLEGRIDQTVTKNNSGSTNLLTAYYPLSILGNEYGIVFSIEKAHFLSIIETSFEKVITGFSLISGLMILLFVLNMRQRKKMFAKLKESEQKQLAILDSMPDLLLLQDENDIFTDGYAYKKELMDVLKTQLIGKTHEAFDKVDTSREYDTILKESRQNKKLAVGEIETSENKSFEVRISPLGDTKSVAIFRDITDKKLAEYNLLKSYERFITVINSIEAIIYVTELETYKILFINEYTRKLFGDIEGTKCFKSLHRKENDPCLNCTILNLAKGKRITRNRDREHFNPVTKRWYKIEEKMIQWFDGKTVLMEIGYDITENKTSVELLKINEAKFRSIYETFLDVYYKISNTGRINMVSPSCEKLIGLKPEELIGTSIFDYYHDRKHIKEFYAILKEKGEVTDYEFRFVKSKEEIITVSVSGRALRDEDGNISEIEGSVRDISERIKTLNEIKEAKERAENADKAKSRFVAGMSHELRTPLNGILGYTQIFLNDESVSEKLKDGIRIIHKSGEHLLTLINDILDISKIDAGKMTLSFQAFDFRELIENIFNMIIVKAREKNLDLRVVYDSDIPAQIIQDEKRLKQVLINLLNNGIKFTAQGYVELRISFSGHTLDVKVIDSGKGIPLEKQEEIFSPFNQIDDHINKTEGTGLGLSISQYFVKLMGGELKVSSEPGKGSTFSFNIPVEADNEKHDKNTLSEFEYSSLQAEDITILLVDDNEINRLVLRKMLQKEGFKTIEAVDGIDAYHKAAKYIPDLIIMDKFMPNMDGIQSTKMILNEQDIPIILVSATKFEEDNREVSDAGFKGIILKPIKSEKLFSMIGEILKLNTKQKTKIFDNTEVIPEQDKIEHLLDLIKKRQMSRFHEYLDQITELNPETGRYTKNLKKLANVFNISGINEILEKNLKHEYDE